MCVVSHSGAVSKCVNGGIGAATSVGGATSSSITGNKRSRSQTQEHDVRSCVDEDMQRDMHGLLHDLGQDASGEPSWEPYTDASGRRRLRFRAEGQQTTVVGSNGEGQGQRRTPVPGASGGGKKPLRAGGGGLRTAKGGGGARRHQGAAAGPVPPAGGIRTMRPKGK